MKNFLTEHFSNAKKIKKIKEQQKLVKKELLEYVDAECEVKTLANEVLFYGVCSSILEMPMLTVQVKLLDKAVETTQSEGLPIKMVFKKGRGKFIVGGNISTTTQSIWDITNIVLLDDIEQRACFRVKTRASGELFGVDEIGVSRKYINEAQLMDISMSGVKFTCEAEFEGGEKVEFSNFELSPNYPPFSFMCTIRPPSEKEVDSEIHRCTIDEQDKVNSELLCKAIFELQREHVKIEKSRR